MPTYIYECKTCEKTFEVEQRITADTLTDCDCGANGSLRRLIQPTAVLFNGSGFFVNDSTRVNTTPADCSGNPTSCQRCSSEPDAS
jgi:putative FmdB family regulatory protein